jgi:hypothetical protein
MGFGCSSDGAGGDENNKKVAAIIENRVMLLSTMKNEW